METNPLEDYTPLQEPILVSLAFQNSFTEIVEKEIIVVNKPNIRGKITIKKTDNLGNPLENVGFTLYAKEDIFENGKVIYYQNEQIGKFYTNSLGQLETNLLPLGKYYFVESNPLNGYIPLSNPIFVELKYNNENSFLVVETLEIENEIFKVPNTYLDTIIYPNTYMYFKENEYEKKNMPWNFIYPM